MKGQLNEMKVYVGGSINIPGGKLFKEFYHDNQTLEEVSVRKNVSGTIGDRVKVDFTGGFLFNYVLKNHFSIQSGVGIYSTGIKEKLYFSEEWIKQKILDNPYLVVIEQLQFTYLTIPVHARYNFGSEKVKFGIYGGIYSGIFLYSKHRRSVEYTNWEEYFGYKKNTIEYERYPDVNKIEIGLESGVYIHYEISPKMSLSLDSQVKYGLTRIANIHLEYLKKRQSYYNNMWAITMGVAYKLN